MKTNVIPSRLKMQLPSLKVIYSLGSPCSVDDVINGVMKEFDLSHSVLEIKHGKRGEPELRWRLRWCLTYLKGIGCLVQPGKTGLYSITDKGINYCADPKMNGTVIEKEYREAKKGEVDDDLLEDEVAERKYAQPLTKATGPVKECAPKPDKKGIKEAMLDLEKGLLTVPQFQRKYVWKIDDCAKLMDSILKGYPIGTFTLWLTEERLRQVKSIAGRKFPEASPGYPVNYVLDGQQRITSIYVCVKGLKIDEVDYSKVYLIPDGYNDEEEIVTTNVEGLEPAQYISIKELYDFDGKTIYQKYGWTVGERIEKYHKLLEMYPLSTIELKNVSLLEATDIFTRINTSGKKLSPFEIVCARVYDEDRRFDLIEKREKQQNKWMAKGYDTIPDYVVLQALSLCIHKSCKKESILKLTVSDLIDNWDRLDAAFDLSIDHLKSFYKITASGLLPYDVLVIPFVYFFFFHQSNDVSPSQNVWLRDYFWRSAITQRFSNAVASKLTQDVQYFEDVLSETQPDATRLPNVNVSYKHIATTGAFVTTSAFIKAILCILAEQHPKSFKNGSDVIIDNTWLSKKNAKNYHHFFSKAYMKKNQSTVPNSKVDHIANITIVDSSLNQFIKDKAPSVYMREFKTNLDLGGTMRSHLIGDFTVFGITDDNYDKFFNMRIEEIRSKLKEKIVPRGSDVLD